MGCHTDNFKDSFNGKEFGSLRFAADFFLGSNHGNSVSDINCKSRGPLNSKNGWDKIVVERSLEAGREIGIKSFEHGTRPTVSWEL
jgi:hypothetical protein